MLKCSFVDDAKHQKKQSYKKNKKSKSPFLKICTFQQLQELQ